MNLKETYNKIAKDWFKDHNSDDWWVGGTDKLISLLSPGATVLDLGCGGGQKTKYLFEHGLSVTGADFAEEMVKLAAKQVPGTQFKVVDWYQIDLLKEKYDCVFAQAVLLHIPKKDVAGLLEKTKKVINPSGLLYLAVKEARPGSPEEEIVTEDDYGYEYQRFFSYYTEPELQKYMSEAGFEVVYSDVASTGKTRWIQIIGKKQKA